MSFRSRGVLVGPKFFNLYCRKYRILNSVHDPDRETLLAKRQWLEERLNAKKEALLEKELIVEEVTSLSEKLRSQAIEGRQGTLNLSQKVSIVFRMPIFTI